MCCQQEKPKQENRTVPPPWHVGVWQAAWHRIQWCVAWLPCVMGHHRIHPVIIDAPDSVFILLESNKRIRVVHVCPDVNSLVTFSGIKSNDNHGESVDQKSLESSSGEDYWFMRWNRPLRLAVQRNSCNCSFRRSQIKTFRESKQESNVIEDKDEDVAAGLRKNDSSSPKMDNNKAEDEEISKSERSDLSGHDEVDMRTGSPQRALGPQSRDVISTSIEHLACTSQNSTDNVNIDEITVSIREAGSEGYINPNFLGSNGNLDYILPSESSDQFVNNQSIVTVQSGSATKESTQDHNANDRSHHVLEEKNARNKNIDCKDQESVGIAIGNKEASGSKKHRKTCHIGTKVYLKKPLLLLIHGAGSSCEVWRGLIHHMVQAGYECVAPDLLGHGLSSAPDVSSSYSFHSLLQDLLNIFDRFVSEGRSAVILGHGYGCSLASAIARYRPEQVVQLVLISGGGPTPLAPRTPPSVSPCMRACLEPLLMCGFKRDVVYSVCGKQMEPCTSETSAVPRHIVHHLAQGHVWPEGDAAFHRRIIAPTLLVHGMRDQHITLVQQCEMERTIPRSFLEVIPEAGHWAMLETPTILSHMVLCFIDWWAPGNRTQ